MIKEVDSGLLVKVKIVPNSSKNELIKEDEFIKVKITAQPIENKANKALIEYLAKLLKMPKSSITIVKGESSKDKTLLFSTNDKNKIEFIISQLTK